MRRQIPIEPEHPERLSNCVTVKQTQLLHCLIWRYPSRDSQSETMYFGYTEQLQLRPPNISHVAYANIINLIYRIKHVFESV